ncbi:MAG: dipeptidase PepV [Solobacterium sp.]|jgi:succinyl-diaminopimelate desuccinylase|nr:dipeptidase PepV [Solobacterium sp.]MCH4206030.1 dipeptidase PepV [Solobacterium sp.]MCH4227526.1 dipeptidase PepV [Solobacterium sp.]MCH4282950.1 dipeptidase PepV [Solobacterium sp.]
MNDVKTMVEGYRDELVSRLGELVAINSEEGTPEADAPFGAGPRDVLKAALQMSQKDGFHTVNLDNYAGYGEIGEGKECIGIVAHLDVVPAHMEDGWKTDPYKMTEKDGILYGRGVSDDKGAAVASMIAMKVLKDMQVPLTKRVRLILGTNEETGSKGLAYYVKKEGSVNYGFTPDGDFPCINGEKGMVSAVYHSKKTGIRSIQGGTAKNIVCRKCTAEVDKCSFSRKKLEDWYNNNSIEYTAEELASTVKITVTGVSAHASTPELGTNAIAYLLVGLKQAGYQDPFVDFFCSHFGLDTDGTGLGIKCNDEYGALTLNCGVIGMKDGAIEGSVDIRYPVTMNSRQIVKMMGEHLSDDGGEVEVKGTIEPLFYPTDSPLVKCLTEAYQEVTGDTETQPMVIGGGTYAKGIDHTIAFGCAFPGNDYHIHDANEWVRVDELLKQAEIYVAGILKLMKI